MAARHQRHSGRCLALLLAGALAGCSPDERPDDALSRPNPPDIPRVMPAAEALAGAHIPAVDPMTMNAAEIEKVLGAGPRCEFRYTSSGRPVLALLAQPQGDAAGGVVKLNGSLVPLELTAAGDTAIALSADPVRLTLSAESAPGDRRQEATLVFTVSDRLTVGYGGYYSCTG